MIKDKLEATTGLFYPKVKSYLTPTSRINSPIDNTIEKSDKSLNINPKIKFEENKQKINFLSFFTKNKKNPIRLINSENNQIN